MGVPKVKNVCYQVRKKSKKKSKKKRTYRDEKVEGLGAAGETTRWALDLTSVFSGENNRLVGGKEFSVYT